MYIKSLEATNFKAFGNFRNCWFLHPGIDKKSLKKHFESEGLKYDNLNVILGNNATGKTAFLKAIALSCLGPSIEEDSAMKTIVPKMWVRRPGKSYAHISNEKGRIKAKFITNEQDAVQFNRIESDLLIKKNEPFDRIFWNHPQRKEWHPVFDLAAPAMFLVGYGASRTVELPENFDLNTRIGGSHLRINKVRSLFEETYQLIPLDSWLPKMKEQNKGRYVQIKGLLSKITGNEHFRFTEKLQNGEYVFAKKNTKLPFSALSDGYRAFLGWVGDLLFHLERTCPSGKKLVENEGIVLIDEIDLHLHPAWQMKILPLLANALPKIQFFVTTHSPLVIGSIEWQNIIYLETRKDGSSYPKRNNINPYGLDADQILVTDMFGLKSTRNNQVADEIRRLSFKASNGDSDSRVRLMQLLTEGGQL